MDSLPWLQEKLYDEMYIGHLPDSWWKKLARWVQDYGHKCYNEGKRDGKREAKGEEEL